MTVPNRRRLLLLGGIALVAAFGIATSGLVGRAHSEQETIRWTEQQAVPTVALALLQHGEAVQKVVLPGNIQPYNKASIYARTNGYLKSWRQDIGARVNAGDVLAVIDTPDLDQQLDQAKAGLASAEANERLAALTAKRWHNLVASQSVSQQAADEKEGDAAVKNAAVDAAKADVRRLEALESFKNVVAPFAGVVTSRNTDIGALINAGSGGQQLFEVSDLRRIRVYVHVPQAVAAEMQQGLKATLEMPQYPGKKFEATLVTTAQAVTESSRSMLVELQADNPDGKLWPGAYCSVEFQVPANANMVRLPATALVVADQGVQVAVVGPDNKVQLKPVQIGRDLGDSVEVLAGLDPADRVIDSPPDTLMSGDSVTVAAGRLADNAGKTEHD